MLLVLQRRLRRAVLDPLIDSRRWARIDYCIYVIDAGAECMLTSRGPTQSMHVLVQSGCRRTQTTSSCTAWNIFHVHEISMTCMVVRAVMLFLSATALLQAKLSSLSHFTTRWPNVETPSRSADNVMQT